MGAHLVLVLHSGDYREAFARRRQGLPDQYRHHTYALEALEALVEQGCRVTVVRAHSPEPFDEEPVPGMRFVGIDPARHRPSAVAELVRETEATHVMLRFLGAGILEELLATGVRLSVVLADSFPHRWRWWRTYRRLGRLLQHPRVELVANHHLASSRQLVDILGVDPAKVIAWDWPLDLLDLAGSSARQHPGTPAPRLLYVGALIRNKGVFDLLGAVRLLRSHGLPVTLDLVGAGDDARVTELLQRHALTGAVHRHGRVGCDQVLALMRAADLVCVPSRITYPEGLPLTIYEAMASGTPVVASDHPMFRDVVRDGETGFVFRQGRPARLAAAIRRAWKAPEAYARVSRAAATSYAGLGLPTLWGDLLHHWVLDPVGDRWVRERALATRGPR